MINLELANNLTAISEISKGKSNSKDFVFNLSKSARTIRDYPEDVRESFYNGRLKNLPGIDKVSYRFIEEYFENGKIDFYERLKSEYSEDLIRLLRISGLGSKRMFKIYDNLGIKSIYDLKNILSDKDILNKKNIDKDILNEFYILRLKRTLNYYDSIKGFFPRWYVLNFLSKIESRLKKIKEIKHFKIVGSFRRKKSFIKDIDFLILPEFNVLNYNLKRSEELIEKIKLEDFSKKLLSKDIRKDSISAKFKSTFGIELEFIISSHKHWALDLLYTTGSMSHVGELEKLANAKGLLKDGKISLITGGDSVNNNFSKINGANFEEFADDKKIYQLLGIQYIPPELRENNGEIELAEKFSIPGLVELKDLKGDLHIHSNWSDGIIDINEVVKKAKKYNFEYIGLSDHSKSNIFGNGLNEKRLLEKINYIDELNRKFKDLILLAGAEVEVRENGIMDYSDDILDKIDIVIGATHSGFINTSNKNTSKAVSALRNKYVDFIAHPTGIVFGNRAPYFIDIVSLIDESKKNNKALEINSYFLRLDLDEKNAKLAKKEGVKLVINTDSHRTNNMDMISLGVNIARRAGLEKDDVLNTMSYKEIKNWKKQR